MAKYISTKEIDAAEVTISKKGKEALAESRAILDGLVEFRQAGEEIFGLVNVNSSPTRVEEGDYILYENGQVVGVKSKAEFEKEYQPVKAAKKEDTK